MNKKLLIGAGAFVMFLIIFIVFGFDEKCPDPKDNIPTTEGYRADCIFEDTVGGGGTPEIELWVLFDNTDAFAQQIQTFESQAEGVRVNVKKFVNIEEYEDLIINEIAEGEGPDVFMIHNSWITQHQGKLLPMPLDQPRVMTPETYRATYFQAASEDMIINEQIYGIPMSIDNLAIFYNKQHFNDLLATSNQPGELWEDIQQQAVGLSRPDNSPERFALSAIALGRADNISTSVDILYAMMLQHGVEFYDPEEQRAIFADNQSGVTGLDQPGVAAFELFTSFALPSYNHYSWNDTITGRAPEEKEVGAFVRGKVSMIVGYPYFYESLNIGIQAQQASGGEHIDLDDIGIAPFPQLVSGNEATQLDTYASYYPLVVSRNTDMPTEAWTLVQFLTSQEALGTYHRITNRPTSRTDMVSDQRIEPLFGTFATQAAFAKSYRIYDDEAYRNIFADAIDQVVSNLATPEQALKEAQTKVTCVLQKEKGIIDVEVDCGV